MSLSCEWVLETITSHDAVLGGLSSALPDVTALWKMQWEMLATVPSSSLETAAKFAEFTAMFLSLSFRSMQALYQANKYTPR